LFAGRGGKNFGDVLKSRVHPVNDNVDETSTLDKLLLCKMSSLSLVNGQHQNSPHASTSAQLSAATLKLHRAFDMVTEAKRHSGLHLAMPMIKQMQNGKRRKGQ
jgi:hypothetical protein